MVVGYMKTMLAVCLLMMATAAQGKLIWFDGSVDESDNPPGKLLSDNEDYWGESVLTGVTYAYEHQPDAPADSRPSRTGQSQRTLLNGFHGAGIGVRNNLPLIVTFDFKQPCIFAEWDVVSKNTRRFNCTLEISGDGKIWKTIFNRKRETCPERLLHRISLPGRPQGRYVRLTMQGGRVTQLNQILAWGDAVAPAEHQEHYSPTARGTFPIGVVFPSVPGIGTTSLSDREAFYWVKGLTAEQRKERAVWFQVPTWDAISNVPLAPPVAEINRPIHLVMARNEVEHVALAIRSTLVEQPQTVDIVQGAVLNAQGQEERRLTSTLGVFGSMGDPGFGTVLGPIFHRGNMLGKSLMRKYVLNGSTICDFPQIRLTPSGVAVMWLTVESKGVEPGVYRTSVSVKGGTPLPVTIEILDVTLPGSEAFVGTYCNGRTDMFPFVHDDRAQRDFDYALSCGISQYSASMSSEERRILEQTAKRQGIRLYYHAGFLVPPMYVHNIYCSVWKKAGDFPENAAAEVAAHVCKVVDNMRSLGLDYSQWYGEICDEPGQNNMAAMAEASRLIKLADPKVKLYLNPCYWAGYDRDAVASDATVSAQLKGWYEKLVDISCPLGLLLDGRPASLKAFTAPRLINASYLVSSQLDRSESSREILKYRRMPWRSLDLGMNGWSFYSYHAPRGSAWNHFDRNPPGEGLQELSDYSMVYPGWRGPVPTRHSEALRQGKEDWRLLNLLKAQGKIGVVRSLLARERQGESPENLRLEALKAAAGR